MADSKITALTSISTSTDPANDPLVIVDVSDTSMAATGTTKKVTLNQLLATSPSATLASATITGDLTVDTSTLKVDSALNKVGVGVATLTGLQTFNVAGDVGITSDLVLKNSGGTVQGYIFGSSGINYRVIAGQPHVWQEGGSDLMRLNSTGLGVGGSVVNKLTVTVAPGTSTSDGFRVTDSTRTIIAGQTGATYSYLGIGGSQNLIYTAGGRLDIVADSQSLFLRTGTNNYLNLDSSGNVGIGVTPSAWFASDRALEFREGWGSVSSSNGTGAMTIANNAYESAGGTWTYKNTNGAGRYEQLLGVHKWFTAPSGTAGNAITFTQAMTLDASGNLLVGKTASSATTVGVQAEPAGALVSTLAASTNATNTFICYSTGAAAYRFYVGMGGTVYATNTTISAISDQRLKENVQDIDVGLGAILALKPRKFDWKEGKGKDIKGDRGFIAQEFEQVFPQLVDEWKDAAPEGEAPYKSVRQDLIPVLVKAIQELTARVQTLEAK